MESEQLLGVLLNTSERQSQSTQALLAQFETQIMALNAAANAAHKAALRVDASATLVSSAINNATPTIQDAVSHAVGIAVKATLADASETAVTAMAEASQPMLKKFSHMILAVSDARDKLVGATTSFGWKWVTLAGATLVCTLSVFLLCVWLLTQWQRHELEGLAAQKEQLSGEVVQLQAQLDTMTKQGGKIKLSQCGPEKRLCVEITPNQGKGINAFQGTWLGQDKKTRYVIPKGY